MFDPRRPKRKVTAEEQEEWLVQYDPLIPDDSRRVISHNYQVSGTILIRCLSVTAFIIGKKHRTYRNVPGAPRINVVGICVWSGPLFVKSSALADIRRAQ